MLKLAFSLLLCLVAVALPAQENTASPSRADTAGNGHFATGYLNHQEKEVIGISGAFKSLAGWEDGRYYILVRDFKPGTIVKVRNTKNNRVIFAKVLGLLPNVKKDGQLLARLSNAGCTALGITTDASFEVIISD